MLGLIFKEVKSVGLPTEKTLLESNFHSDNLA